MKKERGITLIALIVSIIIMLILVAVTITLVAQGGLIDKTKDAKNLTKQRVAEEKQMDNESKYTILEAVINPEEFEYNKTYDKLYINPNPPKLSELNPEVLNIEADQGYRYFNCHSDEDGALWINEDSIQTDWNDSSKTFISQESEPQNPEEFEYWFKPSLNKTYKYINESWTEQNDILVAATKKDIPTNAEIGDLGIYLGMEEPRLMEYMEFNVPSLFVVLIDSKAYAYVHEENDLDFFIQMLGGDIGVKKGWNILTNNDEDELPDIAESINYSEDIFCYTNASFSGDENEFNELNKYLGYFYRSTPW